MSSHSKHTFRPITVCARSTGSWSSERSGGSSPRSTARGDGHLLEDRFLKRLRKKAGKGLRGWPIATIAFYGPNLSQATKITVGIAPSKNAEVEELHDWKVNRGDIRGDPRHRPGDIGIYREASSAIGRDDRRHNRLPLLRSLRSVPRSDATSELSTFRSSSLMLFFPWLLCS